MHHAPQNKIHVILTKLSHSDLWHSPNVVLMMASKAQVLQMALGARAFP
jgi:hypothetical protein